MLTINKEASDYFLDVDTKQCTGTFQNTITKETGNLRFICIAPHIFMLMETDKALPELVIWKLRNMGIIVPTKFCLKQ